MPKTNMQASLLERDIERRARGKRLAEVCSSTTKRNDLLPHLELAYRVPKELVAPSRNVRAIDEAHVKEVANSISAFGFTVPVLIDGDGNILDGVVRVEAAKLVGLQTIPCVVAHSLSAVEKRLLRLAINRLGEKGTWQFDELKVEFEELIVDEAPIDIIGFEVTEIDGILADASTSIEKGPLEPKGSRQSVSRVGDVFLLNRHRVICGDATDPKVLSRLFCTEQAALILTDEPYNVPIVGHVTKSPHREFEMASGEMTTQQFNAFNELWISTAAAHLIDGGLCATFIDWRGLGSVTDAARACGLAQINLVVWTKTNAGMGSLYRSQHELLPLFKKGTASHVNNVDLGRKGRWRSNVWTYAGASTIGSDARQGLKDHPTVKPVSMLNDALLDLTNRDDIVLDPFLGSGSTLIAAEATGRICYGVELDPRYVDVILRRYQKITKKPARLEATGETFASVEHSRKDDPPIASPTDKKHIEQEEDKAAPCVRTRSR